MNLEAILNSFRVPPSNYRFDQVHHGLINQSYKVTDLSSGQPEYFLQSIDTYVFSNIDGLMENIRLVLEHINYKLSAGTLKALKVLPRLVISKKDSPYVKVDGACWRLYSFIEGAYDRQDRSIISAGEAGKLYGEFISSLTDLDPSLLTVTIPRFHDIGWRFEQFNTACSTASVERKEKSCEAIEFAHRMESKMKKSFSLITRESVPIRIVHNDAKLSNVLFDEHGCGLTVVDYDTIMPGYLSLDVGDSLRTIASSLSEDDPHIEKVTFNIDLFKAYYNSFYQAVRSTILPIEIHSIEFSAVYMPFIMGLRMLTDYLNNDIYYHTDYDDHNLVRAKNQFKLVMEIESQSDAIHEFIHELST